MSVAERVAFTEAASRIVVALIESSSGYKQSGNAERDAAAAAAAFTAVYAAVKSANSRQL